MSASTERTRLPAWLSPSELFAASIFCLTLAVSFGAKLIAVGHALLALALVAAFLERGRRAFDPGQIGGSGIALTAIVGFSALSIFANLALTQSPLMSLGKLRFPVMVVLLAGMPWVVRGPLSRIWRRDALVLAWLIPLLLVMGVSLLSWRLGYHALRGRDVADFARVSGIYGQVMTFAYSFQFSFVALAAFFITPDAWRRFTRVPRWVAIAFLFMSGGILYLTYTRGALLGAASGLATIAVIRSWKLCVLLVLIGLAGALIARVDGARYLSMENDIRAGQWRAAALSFLERPVFGLGFRNFEIHCADLKERYGFEKDLIRERGKPPREDYFRGHAHNNILEAFASTGVGGGIAFLAFCFCWWREAAASRHKLLLLPLISAFVVSGLFENTFSDSEVLNCILLIWLASQWLFAAEAGEKWQAGLPESV